MAYVMETVLKREVDNYWEAWKDAVLYVLYQWHVYPFNSVDIPMNLERISADMAKEGHDKVSMKEITDICEKLCKEGYLEKLESGKPFYKITPEGVEVVQKLLTRF